MLRFDGKVALVTGAGRGLGRAYALALAARGASVVVNELPGDGAAAGADVVAEIEASGGRAMLSEADVSLPAGALAVADTVRRRYGRLDVLVNNAGVAHVAEFDAPLEDFHRIVEINLFSAVNMTYAAWPDLKRSAAGRVVMTTSAIGLWGAPGQSAYATAKAGVLGLVRSLALEGAAARIAVNAVAPAAQTRLTAARFDKPSRRWRPELVAPAVLYLAHEKCTLNGAVLAALSGLIARVEVVQSAGHRFDGRAELTVDDVAEAIDDVVALDETTTFANGHVDALGRPLGLDLTAVTMEGR